mgnify:CR=1 FL=1
MNTILQLRQTYHRNLCHSVIYQKQGNKPSIADVASDLSVSLARQLMTNIQIPVSGREIPGQTAGKQFEVVTRDFLRDAFSLLNHLRPGDWQSSLEGAISQYAQYEHIARLSELIKNSPELRTSLGDYVVTPDIIVARAPVSDAAINEHGTIVTAEGQPRLTPLRADIIDKAKPILHASISCKLTLRSDRSQNARTEGLNLIRNRKGGTPHIAVVTAEPMPSRIASLALGTGDIDCVYHFALPELTAAARSIGNEAVTDTLNELIQGNRLRDISDLPFDLAI